MDFGFKSLFLENFMKRVCEVSRDSVRKINKILMKFFHYLICYAISEEKNCQRNFLLGKLFYRFS
jgi:hypothetical protein